MKAPNQPVVQIRPDIQWTLHQDQRRWVAHDPLNARFFYFNGLEHTTACLLRGEQNLAQILDELRRRFPHLNLTIEWLVQFVSRLGAAHLLLPSSNQVISRLIQGRRGSGSGSLLRILGSPLSLRIPLLNPAPWLELLRPIASVLFARVTFVFVLCLTLLTGIAVCARLINSPHLLHVDMALVQGDRWMMLIGCYILVKSLHELGHGLACVRWKAKCHELGLLILFFTPCMYCDTTDAWKLSSKWQRAAICAAGIYVEMILASMASILWLFTQDGTVHSIAANIMLICSVGTLLVNGNPFLKYDGYYILSDLWGVPNLSDQSREASLLLFQRVMTGKPVDASHLDRSVVWLSAYAAISLVYRAFVLIMILWLAWSMLVPMGLGFVALMIFTGIFMGLTLATWRTIQQVHHHVLANQSMQFIRLVILLTSLLLAIAFISQVPLPVVIQARGVADFGDKQPLFAPEHCTLMDAAEVGQVIQPGDRLVQFDAPEKRWEMKKVECEIALLKEKLAFLNQTASLDPSSTFELPLTQQLLTERQTQAALLERELSTLDQRAPHRGRLIPSSTAIPRPLTSPRDLAWSTSPLEPSNRGCALERGMLLGWFTASTELEITTLVPEQQMKQLRPGMIASCRWDSRVENIRTGRIVRIAPDPIERTPDELVGDSTLFSTRNAAGNFQPQEPHYAVVIALENHSAPDKSGAMSTRDNNLLRGSLVTVQIHVDSQPLLKTMLHAIRLSLKLGDRS